MDVHKITKANLKLQPESFLITISDNVYSTHDEVELSSIKQSLKGKYILFESILPVWKYGDPTARNWLLIVGVSRKLGQCAYDFRFPTPKFDATLWPRATCIVDSDCVVPDECWLDGNIQITHQVTIKPERPSIHRISTAKRKSGISARVVYSWESLLNNQTGCFGRCLRPPLE